jgi:UDP-glucuronate decarboxylase
VARIFNTYGPRMHPDDGRVVSNFIMQALRGEPITIYGKGSQTRSFCYVDDLVDGIMRLMASDDALLGPVNLGNPNEMSVRELAEQVVEMTGSRSRLIFKPLPVDDPKQRQPDITLARHKLNWTPKGQLARRPGTHDRLFSIGGGRQRSRRRREVQNHDRQEKPADPIRS